MHLKTLTVRGFKSFASATTFDFEPGVTAVVGPNGSGKSNVVDALAWVMGEQGAKSLRGGKMEDVIFAGTSGRAALGRAHVSLTIDNADGALPIEYSEVTISRTLFRSGGSEYAINGRSCRLLDIQELLSDSGLGREMHVIVGQGQLDRILQATPEDRRGFIEESSWAARLWAMTMLYATRAAPAAWDSAWVWAMLGSSRNLYARRSMTGSGAAVAAMAPPHTGWTVAGDTDAMGPHRHA